MKKKLMAAFIISLLIGVAFALVGCSGGLNDDLDDIKIGSSYKSEVQRILGQPDEETDTLWTYYDSSYKSLQNKIDKNGADTEKALMNGDDDKLLKLFEESVKLEEQLEKLVYTRTQIYFNGGCVSEIISDAACSANSGEQAKKAVESTTLEFDCGFYYTDAVTDKKAVIGCEKVVGTVRYTDGSYRKANISDCKQTVKNENGNSKVTVKWTDSWGEYSATATYKKGLREQHVATIDKNGVWNTEDGAWSDFKMVGEFEFPASVKVINGIALHYLQNAEKITIPDTVELINDRISTESPYYKDENNWKNGGLYAGKHLLAVKDEAMENFTFEPGTVSIAGGAFEYVYTRDPSSGDGSSNAISELKIPEGVKGVGSYSLTAAKKIELPASLTRIGLNAIEGHYDSDISHEITIADGNKFYKVINSCVIETANSKLIYSNKDNEIPEGVKIIGKETFSFRYISESTLVIPEGVEEIQDEAFANLGGRQMTAISFPSTLKTIGRRAFLNALLWVTEIVIPDSVTFIGEQAFQSCGVEKVVIGDGVTELTETFHGCRKLKEFKLGNSIVKLDSVTDSYCKLTEVNIPLSVKKMEDPFGVYGMVYNYAGTKAQWAQIDIMRLGYSYTVHCTDGDIIADNG